MLHALKCLQLLQHGLNKEAFELQEALRLREKKVAKEVIAVSVGPKSSQVVTSSLW